MLLAHAEAVRIFREELNFEVLSLYIREFRQKSEEFAEQSGKARAIERAIESTFFLTHCGVGSRRNQQASQSKALTTPNNFRQPDDIL